WANSIADTRALQKASLPSVRVLAAWYGNVFTIDLAFKDSNPHQVAFYMMDYDLNGGGRSQTVQILDPNGNVLDTRNVPGFYGGQDRKRDVKGKGVDKGGSSNR